MKARNGEYRRVDDSVRSKMNGKIDLMKFIMSLVIMMFHTKIFLGEETAPFLRGSFAVEFFFIVSGYLFMVSYVKEKKTANVRLSIADRTLTMIKKRFCRMNPEIMLAFFIGCVVLYITKYNTIKSAVNNLIIHSWTQPLGLCMTGLEGGHVDGVLWYISTLLIASLILYPFMLKYGDDFTKLWAPFLGIMLLGFLRMQYGLVRDPWKWDCITYRGNIRGLAEICLGIGCYYLAGYIRKTDFRSWVRVCFCLFEWTVYFTIVAYMQFFSHKGDIFFILLLCIAISISFGNEEFDDRIFDKKIFHVLGKFSFSLFCCHIYWAYILEKIVPKESTPGYKILVYCVVSFITAVVVQGVSNLWRQYNFSKYMIKLCITDKTEKNNNPF